MKKIILLLICLGVFGSYTRAQPSNAGTLKFRGSKTTASGDALPCSPDVANLYYDTTARAFKFCRATNTWAAIGGGTAPVASESGTTANLTNGGRSIAKNNSARLVFTLPSTCTEGQPIDVNGYGAGGWRIGQNAGQIVHGTSDTTTGTAGFIQSQGRYDSVTLICVVANTEWLISNSQGTLTIN